MALLPGDEASAQGQAGPGQTDPGWAECTSGAETPSDIPLVTEIGHG